MKLSRTFFSILISFSVCFIGCSSENADQKDHGEAAANATQSPGESNAPPKVKGSIPEIDTASLKTEAAVLNALEKVVDARIQDDARSDENPNYESSYGELLRLYTAVLARSTTFMESIEGAKNKLEFHRKVGEVTDKLYDSMRQQQAK